MIEDKLPLLILDLDETLVFTTTSEPVNVLEEYDFIWYSPTVGIYRIKKRPGLDEFLNKVKIYFRIGIWSAAEESYVNFISKNIIKPIVEPVFVWSGKKCTFKRLLNTEFQNKVIIIKDLKKVWRKKKYNKYNTIVVDDNFTTFMRNYGNAIPITSFQGNKQDVSLEKLWDVYLSKLITSKNMRQDLTFLKEGLEAERKKNIES